MALQEKKHAETKFTDLQKQLSTLEETIKSERQGHRRALDTVQTDHAFKVSIFPSGVVATLTVGRRCTTSNPLTSKPASAQPNAHAKCNPLHPAPTG